MIKKPITTADTLAHIEGRKSDAIESYVRRGRRLEHLTRRELRTQWKAAKVIFAAEPTFENRNLVDDFEAEFTLRKLPLPRDKEVDAAMNAFVERTVAALEALRSDPVRWAQINAEFSRDIANARDAAKAVKKN